MEVQVLNPVFSQVSSRRDVEYLSSILRFKAETWRDGPYHKTRKSIDRVLVKRGLFLTGFLPRIKETCAGDNVPFAVYDCSHQTEFLRFLNSGHLTGITLDEHQSEAVEAALRHRRGVIHHPTGSGKTILFLYLISMFPLCNSLVIVNTQDLLLQTKDRMQKYFPGECIGIVGQGVFSPARITVATIQTLNNLTPEGISKLSPDVLIIDEAHHVSKFASPFSFRGQEGSYAKVLSVLQAPIRLGFTATLPYLEEAKMALEGYVGPVISSKSIQEIGRLARIKILLKKLPVTESIRDTKTYRDVYKMGVVYNSRRNRAVILEADKLVAEGRSVLILVTQIEHGLNISKMFDRIFPELSVKFVWSEVHSTDREIIKKELEQGTTKVVIADAVWKEGVDIPSLGAIVNAAGGKSEIMTLQNLGRGLRTVPGVKEDVILVDFFDPSHRYLVDHFGHRISLYFDEGWL